MTQVRKPFFPSLKSLDNSPFPQKYPLFWNVGLTGVFFLLISIDWIAFLLLNSFYWIADFEEIFLYLMMNPFNPISDLLLAIDLSIPTVLLLIGLFYPLKNYSSALFWAISLFVPYHLSLAILTIIEISAGDKIGEILYLLSHLLEQSEFFLYLLSVIFILVSFKVLNKLTLPKGPEKEIPEAEGDIQFKVMRKNARLIQGAAVLILLICLSTLVITLQGEQEPLKQMNLIILLASSVIFLPPLVILSSVNFMMLSKIKEPTLDASSPLAPQEMIAKIGIATYLLYATYPNHPIDFSASLWYFIFMAFNRIGLFFLIVNGMGRSRALQTTQPSSETTLLEEN